MGLTAPRLTPLGGGMNSQTWLVECDGARYVAKRVQASDVEALLHGCAAAARLGDLGLVTGKPVPTTRGDLAAADVGLALLTYIPGRELDGESAEEQRAIASTLARAHWLAGPTEGRGTTGFLDDWLAPGAIETEDHPWVPSLIAVVRAQTDPTPVTWSVLHTDPAPEAFLLDEANGVTGLIDWAGAQPGPVLYDVASAVMYLGGPEAAGAFLETYRATGPLSDGEWHLLDAYRRFRWAVQAAYFAHRLTCNDLTGIDDPSENEHGLARARRGLADLGIDVS